MSGTVESISAARASSIARSSAPTATATRSFRSASSGVGGFTVGRDGDESTDDDAVFHLDLRPRGEALDLDHRELVLDFHDLARGDLLVQFAQQLTGDGMHDGNLVAAKAHGVA